MVNDIKTYKRVFYCKKAHIKTGAGVKYRVKTGNHIIFFIFNERTGRQEIYNEFLMEHIKTGRSTIFLNYTENQLKKYYMSEQQVRAEKLKKLNDIRAKEKE